MKSESWPKILRTFPFHFNGLYNGGISSNIFIILFSYGTWIWWIIYVYFQRNRKSCPFFEFYLSSYSSITITSKFVYLKFHISITATSFVMKWYKYFHEIKTRRASKSYSTRNVICNWKDFPIWNGKWVFLIFLLVYL